MRADGPVAEGQPETLLDGISAVAGYHNGGDLAFGADGSLFVALGEAHEPDRAQDETDIGGKIARLDGRRAVPPDNPFGPDNPVWSIGHRNSFGLCVDPATGTLWETENGPDVDDEVNVIEPGGNYGWPAVTGISDEDEFIDPRRWSSATRSPSPDARWLAATCGSDRSTADCGVLPASADAAVDAEEIARFPAGVTDVLLGPGRCPLRRHRGLDLDTAPRGDERIHPDPDPGAARLTVGRPLAASGGHGGRRQRVASVDRGRRARRAGGRARRPVRGRSPAPARRSWRRSMSAQAGFGRFM